MSSPISDQRRLETDFPTLSSDLMEGAGKQGVTPAALYRRLESLTKAEWSCASEDGEPLAKQKSMEATLKKIKKKMCAWREKLLDQQYRATKERSTGGCQALLRQMGDQMQKAIRENLADVNLEAMGFHIEGEQIEKARELIRGSRDLTHTFKEIMENRSLIEKLRCDGTLQIVSWKTSAKSAPDWDDVVHLDRIHRLFAQVSQAVEEEIRLCTPFERELNRLLAERTVSVAPVSLSMHLT